MELAGSDALAALEAAAEQCCAQATDAPSTEEAGQELRRLRAVIDRLEGRHARVLRQFDARDGRAGGQSQECGGVAASRAAVVTCGRSKPGAAGTCVAGAARDPRALAAGRISAAHAAVICAAQDAVGIEVVQGAEVTLVEAAERVDPKQLRQLVRHLQHVVDPDGAEQAAVNAMDRRHFDVNPVGDMVAVNGLLDPETGMMLKTVVDANARPEEGDVRASTQRRADAIGTIRRRILDQGLPIGGGVRPHLTVTVDWRALIGAAGASPAQLTGFGPIDRALLRKLACDSSVARVVLGPDSAPLGLGRAVRVASPAQRRGVLARARGTCEIPGCRSTHVEVHHIGNWIDGGPTDMTNLVALCSRDLTRVRQGAFHLKRLPAGQLEVWTAAGRHLVDHDRAARRGLDNWCQQPPVGPPRPRPTPHRRM